MLPEHYCEDDKRWLRQQISMLPVALQASTAKKYSDVFLAEFDAEPMEHKKDNVARRVANTRLRNYIQAIKKPR